ncbi:MAG: hypothetical protein ACFE0I_11745 [Elainellaceae cyanobacterium]
MDRHVLFYANFPDLGAIAIAQCNSPLIPSPEIIPQSRRGDRRSPQCNTQRLHRPI